MKNNDGASQTYEEFLNRNGLLNAYNQRAAEAEAKTKSGGDYSSAIMNSDGTYTTVVDDSTEFRANKAFNKFNAVAKKNTNPFANASAFRAKNAQNQLDNLNVGNSARMAREADNARDAIIDGKGDTQEDLAANSQTISPVAGPPMSNGTGSARPTFSERASKNIKEINKGDSIKNILFKKK